jgi:hypothetical protein
VLSGTGDSHALLLHFWRQLGGGEDSPAFQGFRALAGRICRREAGVRYLDFTPVVVVAGALVVGLRYVAIGLGDTSLYVLAGMAAALFLALRIFLFRGMGRAD